MPEGAAWVRKAGSGRVVQGRCVLLGFLWRCDKNDEECDVYDGLDATSGRPFTEMIGDGSSFYSFPLGEGIEFAEGIYVDQTTVNDVITVYFRQID